MGEEDAGPKVDNPDRARLVELQTKLVNERTDFVTTFQLAEKEIDRGSATAELAWIGHKAEQWHDHMASHRSKVRERYDAVLEEVGRRINSMPDKVTPEQAMAMSRNRRMP